MLLAGYLILFFGFCFIFSGIVGIFRFRGFFPKIHACGVLDGCGAFLVFMGLAIISYGRFNFADIAKTFFAAFLLLLLGPISSHALGKIKLEIDKKNI